MEWVKKRNTTYEEDKGYSLLGIFDVYIPLLYGEGEVGAFARLREKISKDFHRLTDLRSVNPHLEKERIETVKGSLVVNAYRSSFKSLNLNKWRHLPESQTLWIRGDSGKGKTILLYNIISKLERIIIANRHYHNLVYFFCQATDLWINSATAVLRGLIYMLIHRQPRLISHLPENTYPANDATVWIVLSKVFNKMLQDANLKVTYLVIDALNEYVTDLSKLLDLAVCLSGHVKWLVLSQNKAVIEIKLRSGHGLMEFRLRSETNAEYMSRNINRYIDNKLSSLASLQDDIPLKDRVRDILR